LIRILTSIVLLLILAGALWLPPTAFVIILAVFLAVAWSEYARLATSVGATPLYLYGFGALLPITCTASFADSDPHTPITVTAVALLLSATLGLATGRHHPTIAIRGTIATVGGICWLGVLPGFYIALRYEPQGVALISLLFVAVSFGDVAAYYGGSLFGHRPLAPNLSPQKTIEGALFGLAGSSIGGAIVVHYWIVGATWPIGVAIGLLLGAVGQVGDLFESALKRAANTKDSSSILPGHGGILDRLDALLFGGATLYAAVYFGLL
jgi:phosphatidate cytidylyltransferase